MYGRCINSKSNHPFPLGYYWASLLSILVVIPCFADFGQTDSDNLSEILEESSLSRQYLNGMYDIVDRMRYVGSDVSNLSANSDEITSDVDSIETNVRMMRSRVNTLQETVSQIYTLLSGGGSSTNPPGPGGSDLEYDYTSYLSSIETNVQFLASIYNSITSISQIAEQSTNIFSQIANYEYTNSVLLRQAMRTTDESDIDGFSPSLSVSVTNTYNALMLNKIYDLMRTNQLSSVSSNALDLSSISNLLLRIDAWNGLQTLAGSTIFTFWQNDSQDARQLANDISKYLAGQISLYDFSIKWGWWYEGILDKVRDFYLTNREITSQEEFNGFISSLKWYFPDSLSDTQIQNMLVRLSGSLGYQRFKQYGTYYLTRNTSNQLDSIDSKMLIYSNALYSSGGLPFDLSQPFNSDGTVNISASNNVESVASGFGFWNADPSAPNQNQIEIVKEDTSEESLGGTGYNFIKTGVDVLHPITQQVSFVSHTTSNQFSSATRHLQSKYEDFANLYDASPMLRIDAFDFEPLEGVTYHIPNISPAVEPHSSLYEIGLVVAYVIRFLGFSGFVGYVIHVIFSAYKSDGITFPSSAS